VYRLVVEPPPLIPAILAAYRPGCEAQQEWIAQMDQIPKMKSFG
jgi:hypothetical protein